MAYFFDFRRDIWKRMWFANKQNGKCDDKIINFRKMALNLVF